MEFTSITGPLTGRPVRFGIYLPQQYFSRPEQDFAVLYFLHGLNQDHTDNLEIVATALERAVERKIVRPMLVVTPDGYTNSMWADSKSGHKPAEANLIRELIPYIESTYRVSACLGRRFIGGFSMGGYGACRIAVKFPELFDTCFSMDGALHTLNTLKRLRGPVFAEIFENDEAYFRQYCLYELARENRQAIAGHFFHIVVGMLKSFNDRFRRLFAGLGIDVGDAHFRLTGCGHDAACMMERSGLELFGLLEKRMVPNDTTKRIRNRRPPR